ncbi:formylglycine-generating enzyme family protein [Roseateles sp. BYS180W]|uniref:Formylglycine-generating enzyme family protein n=1 Tax=Roseateles rivi TaxID=3299028 RepID=A0ABW7FS21_9BURK
MKQNSCLTPPSPARWVLLAAAVALAGCDSRATGAAAPSAEVQARVEALAQRSKQRLSHVPAGGFWLGDPGPLMTEELKATGAVLGPEAQLTGNPPYTRDEDNKPPRWVTLDAYSIQQLKVTYGDFDVYVAANALPPHPPQGDEPVSNRGWRRSRTSDDTPAGVTWVQAQAYCAWLGKVTGLPFALPTEAQWEYAASNGRKTHYEPAPTDNGILEEGRNHPTYGQIKALNKNSGMLYPVGRFPPSKLKLHDMVGNGYEWTQDWYAPDTYQTLQQTHNPAGPASGVQKVLRGSPPNEDMIRGFVLTERTARLPEGETFRGRRVAYSYESFRCVVNQPAPLPGTYVDGPGSVVHPLRDRPKP